MESLVPQQFKTDSGRGRWLREHQYDLILLFAVFVGVFTVYHTLSDGDFSFLLTLGGCLRLLAFAILLFRCRQGRRCAGVSLKTLQLYFAVFFFRLRSDLFYEGYLPFDSSGDWLYSLVDVLALCAVGALVYLVRWRYRKSYDFESDSWGAALGFSSLGTVALALGCALLAVLVHPSLNHSFWVDTSWTLALYLESVCVLPQLHMFHKSRRAVEPWMSHFTFLLFLSRACLFIFWVSTHHELNHHGPSVAGGWVGYFVIGCQAVQMLTMANFAFHYVRSAARKEDLLLQL